MKNTFTKIAIVCLVGLSFSACKDEKETDREMERLFRANIKDAWGKSCLTVKMKKESDKQYFVDAMLSDSSRLQAMMVGSPDEETKITETLNSVSARLVTENVGQFCTDLVLKQQDSIMYKGTATLKSGEVLKIMVNPEKGWYPENDSASLATVMKYQLKRDNSYKNIVVAMQNVTPYEYIATVTADDKLFKFKVVHLGTQFKYDLMQLDPQK